jgi:hypothetical protein
MIGDIDDDGLDAIVRYLLEEDEPFDADRVTATWYVSWRGATAWAPEPLATREWRVYSPDRPSPADSVRSFIGRFNTWRGSDLLLLDTDRKAYIYRHGRIGFSGHSLYAF